MPYRLDWKHSFLQIKLGGDDDNGQWMKHDENGCQFSVTEHEYFRLPDSCAREGPCLISSPVAPMELTSSCKQGSMINVGIGTHQLIEWLNLKMDLYMIDNPH